MRPATTGERLRPHGMTGSTEFACPRVRPASGWKYPWNRAFPRAQPERILGRERIEPRGIKFDRMSDLS